PPKISTPPLHDALPISTLLRMIAGLNELDQGQILVHGQPITGPSPERAMVFQSFALMPWADVMRNVTFGLELQGMPRSEREAIGDRKSTRLNSSHVKSS